MREENPFLDKAYEKELQAMTNNQLYGAMRFHIWQNSHGEKDAKEKLQQVLDVYLSRGKSATR